MSCGVGRRRGSDLALLWLRCRLAATAPIGPLAWESPYATGAAPKKTKKTKQYMALHCIYSYSHSIDIILGIISNLEMIQSMWEKRHTDGQKTYEKGSSRRGAVVNESD